MRQALRHPAAWWALLVLGLLPLAWLGGQIWQDQLGANPAEALIRTTGDWTLRSLCVVLAVTPLRQLLAWPELVRFRRMLGLLTFAYAFLHLLCYAWFDMGFDWVDMVQDIAKRPFILLGFSAFLILLALATTSFNRAIRQLGARRWQALHRAVYAVAVLAILHFWWMRAGKQNFAEVFVYAAILISLLGWRLARRGRSR
ncbi:sulfoxide reductase heme-binding subunit YedZ [Limnohabitans sp. 2KL-17]|uniref:sulfite oxidase heme-binding subunit YedZ n=1 Tax=Limnohabitans sp. 2KL-17 TaxID=1100704 RepID=UPI000D3D5A1B|nr:protein-methionine-sulfoxide reductase heme-binding subunit MsrQ [Limnohabitans sp. 2KL-17]PUE52231.1 sulfoxide reductase heme-binding subunit YedZ [Limnohabitans sp. 2KL-17]